MRTRWSYSANVGEVVGVVWGRGISCRRTGLVLVDTVGEVCLCLLRGENE